MILQKWMTFVILLNLVVIAEGNTARVCFYSGISTFRDEHGIVLEISHIDPFICTHVIFASAELTENVDGIKLPDAYNQQKIFRDLNSLKIRNPQLKTMLSVGGWDQDTRKWHRLVSSRANMVRFAREVSNFLKLHSFDGLNIDWEYPATRGSPAADKIAYAELIEVLRHHFGVGLQGEELEDMVHQPNTLLLSVCVVPTSDMIAKSYDLLRIARSVDFINLHLYDLYGHWDEPMRVYPHSALTDDLGIKNVNTLLRGLVNQHIPKHKLVLGIPFYGRSYQLQDRNFTSPGSLAVGPGSDEGDGYPVKNLCHLIKHGGITEQTFAGVPYIVTEDEWISYDNPVSVQEKATLVWHNQLGGVYIWSIDMDDHSGTCGTKYPMMTAVLQGLHAYDQYLLNRQILGSLPQAGTHSEGEDTGSNSQQPRQWQNPRATQVLDRAGASTWQTRAWSRQTDITKTTTTSSPQFFW